MNGLSSVSYGRLNVAAVNATKPAARLTFNHVRASMTARLVVRLVLALAVWLESPLVAAAQGGLLSSIADGHGAHDGQAGQPGQTSPDAPIAEYPSLRISGFGNIDFAAQNKSEGPRGFNEGQFVLHLASALSPRVNFFGEMSFTPRADAGTGSPAATGFNAEVERAIRIRTRDRPPTRLAARR